MNAYYSVAVLAPEQPRQLLRVLLALRQHAAPVEVLVLGASAASVGVLRLAQLPARVVPLPEDSTRASAFNLALDTAANDALLLMDRDVLLESDPAAGVALLGARADVGVVGAALLSEGGVPRRVLHAGYAVGRGRLCPSTIAWDAGETDLPADPYEVAAASDACLLVRRTDLRFDERYGPRLADVDFCFQYRQRGFSALLAPAIRALRSSGGSGGLSWDEGLRLGVAHLSGQWLYHARWCSSLPIDQHPPQPAVRGAAARAFRREAMTRHHLDR